MRTNAARDRAEIDRACRREQPETIDGNVV
jgi:hypothetical protein